jgi:DNA-binding beta-propeller fold protein YncE
MHVWLNPNLGGEAMYRLFHAGILLAVVVGVSAVSLDVCSAHEPMRINLAKCYKVDPSWPKAADEMDWGAVPGVAVDEEDRVYVFTRAKTPIRIYDKNGKFQRGFGEGDIKSAHYLKLDPEGNIWVTDIGNHTVLKYSPKGKLLLEIGTRGKSGCDKTHMNKPTDVAVTPSGDIFVSDGYGNNRVVHFDRNGKYVKEWGKGGIANGQFNVPHAIAVDSKGKLFVADRSNVRIQVFDQKGKFLEDWRNLLVPWGLSMTAKDEIWACGSSPMAWPEKGKFLGCPPKDQLFMKIDTSGRVREMWTIPKGKDGEEKPGEVNWLHAIDVDSQGNVYAGDIKGERVQKFVLMKHEHEHGH